MPTPATEERPLGEAVREVSTRASALVRLELELAALELKRKVAALGVGIALGIGALVLLLYALGFALSAGVSALDGTVPDWAAALIVAGALALVAAILGMLALRAVKRGTPPVPQQAIEEAKRTTQALRSDGSRA